MKGDDELPPLGSGRQVKGKPDRVTQAIVVALLLGVAVMGWQEMRESEALETGTTAPDATLERLDGTTFALSSLEGRVVLIDFWAAHCPPCRQEMPWLVKLADSYEARGVTFVALNTEEGRDKGGTAAKFIDTIPGLAKYAAFGPGEVAFVYRVVALPTLFVLDREGRVRAVRVGAVSEGQVRALLDEALGD